MCAIVCFSEGSRVLTMFVQCSLITNVAAGRWNSQVAPTNVVAGTQCFKISWHSTNSRSGSFRGAVLFQVELTTGVCLPVRAVFVQGCRAVSGGADHRCLSGVSAGPGSRTAGRTAVYCVRLRLHGRRYVCRHHGFGTLPL